MNPSTLPHQYIDRNSRQVITEKPIGDRTIQFIYNTLRESAPTMFRLLVSGRISSLLGFYHYDRPGKTRGSAKELFIRSGVDWQECVEPLDFFDSHRKFFERRIRYWETRPMNREPTAIVSPADARVLIGSFAEISTLFIKDKFFDLQELLGSDSSWYPRFLNGDFAVFRLTPDKYHYTHVPVTGRVAAIYNVDGCYHSCNPSALVSTASLYSKNRRIVTIIDTDVEGGSIIGLVAMVEIVALMIGDIVPTYSENGYEDQRDIRPGQMVKRGCPKSLFRPGSSTVVLVFEAERIVFADDLIQNSQRRDVQSRFTGGFDRPLVETDVRVRSSIAESLRCTQKFDKGKHI
jgi:phosphatidylserine decarboxylase